MKNSNFLQMILLGAVLVGNAYTMDNNKQEKESEENSQDSKIDITANDVLNITQSYRMNNYKDQGALMSKQNNNQALQPLVDNNRELIVQSSDGQQVQILVKDAIGSITLKEWILEAVDMTNNKVPVRPLDMINGETLVHIVEALQII